VTDVPAAPPAVSLTPGDRRRLERLERLAAFLDNALRIPGTRFRIGLDPIVGLVPGLGDALGTAFAGYILLEAVRLGVSGPVFTRMVANIAIDTAIGAIPGVGDLFDFAWKSDAMNVALLRAHLERPLATRRASRRLLAAGALVLLLAALGAMVGAVVLLRYLVAHTPLF